MLTAMAIDNILAQLDAEIARLKQVRNLLSATGKVDAKITAVKHKPTKKARQSAKPGPKAKTGVKRVLSPEARKAIADAQRHRWAAQKVESLNSARRLRSGLTQATSRLSCRGCCCFGYVRWCLEHKYHASNKELPQVLLGVRPAKWATRQATKSLPLRQPLCIPAFPND